jgi:hypothetical protein
MCVVGPTPEVAPGPDNVRFRISSVRSASLRGQNLTAQCASFRRIAARSLLVAASEKSPAAAARDIALAISDDRIRTTVQTTMRYDDSRRDLAGSVAASLATIIDGDDQ